MIGLSILPSGLPPNNGNMYVSPPDSNYANDYNAYMMQSFGYYLITRIGLPICGGGMLGYVYMYRGGFIYDDNEEAPVRRGLNRRVTIAPEPIVMRVSRQEPVAHVPPVAPAAAVAPAHVAPAAVAPAAVAPVAASAPKPTSVGVNHNPSSANHLPPSHNTYELRPLPDIRYEENMRRYKQWLGHQPLTFSQNAQFYKQTA